MKREDQLFFIGLLSLLISLFLFPFVAYLFPVVWLGFEYRMPDFVLDIVLWIEGAFHLNYSLALRWFFRCIFLAAALFGFVAYRIAHHISVLQAEADLTETEMKAVEKISVKAKQSSKESVRFFLKMVVILSLVFIVSDVIQWAISLSLTTS